MTNQASKRARRIVKRGKVWESQVAKDVRGRRTPGPGADILDWFGRPIEAKRRKTAARWLWQHYYDCHGWCYSGFCIPGQALFIPYFDGLRYMYPVGYDEDEAWPNEFEWQFPRILVLVPVIRGLPNYLRDMLEQARCDMNRERPGNVTRVALHVDQRKVGYGAMELWMFDWKEFVEYGKENNPNR